MERRVHQEHLQVGCSPRNLRGTEEYALTGTLQTKLFVVMP